MERQNSQVHPSHGRVQTSSNPASLPNRSSRRGVVLIGQKADGTTERIRWNGSITSREAAGKLVSLRERIDGSSEGMRIAMERHECWRAARSTLGWVWSFVLIMTFAAPVRAAEIAAWGDVFEDAELRSSARSFAERLKSPFQPSDEEPLVTDRPDFTEASSVVGRGRVQLESGYTFVRDRSAGIETTAHAVPQFVWRIGVTEAIELRIVWDAGYLFEREVDRTTGTVTKQSGGTDMDLGVKIALTKQDHWIPESALIATLSAPTGASEFRSYKTQPRSNLLYSWDLNEDISLACSTGLAALTEGDDNFIFFHQSASLGFSLTDKWGMYTEWFVHAFSGAEVSAPQHYADGGFTYQFTPNFQVDWRIGFGLNEHADDLFTGVGYALRW